MTASQRERALSACKKINSHETPSIDLLKKYHAEIVDLLSEIPLADNEKRNLNCEDL